MGQCSSTNTRRYRYRINTQNLGGSSRKVVPTSIKDQECSICLEPLILYSRRINCGHEFHKHCLARHKHTCRKYGREYNCPLCRKKI